MRRVRLEKGDLISWFLRHALVTVCFYPSRCISVSSWLTICRAAGCIHKVVRVDLNRGPVKSLKYSMSQDGKWGSSFGHFRYKKDTEIVLGCSG
jgi:hypothetical protein